MAVQKRSKTHAMGHAVIIINFRFAGTPLYHITTVQLSRYLSFCGLVCCVCVCVCQCDEFY